MAQKFDCVKIGDIVVAKAGRDDEKFFLVVNVEEKFCYLVDGKTRKVGNEKKKNIKHVTVLIQEADVELANKIKNGAPTANDRVKKRIKEFVNKIQEE